MRFTEGALQRVILIAVVVSIKRTHVIAVRAATWACEYLVRVAALGVVEKLHCDRLGGCDPLWVLLSMLFKPPHLVVRLKDEGCSVRSGVVAGIVARDAEKNGALRIEISTSKRWA